MRNDLTGTQRWLLPMLLIGSLACRLVFWTGPTGSDDVAYFYFAEKFAALAPFSDLHHSVRLVFLILVGVPAALAGSMTAGIMINVLFASINDALVAWIAGRAYGASASIVALVLMAFCGVNVIFPSTFLPDTLLTSFFLLTFIVVWQATTDAAPRLGMLFAAGALTGAAYAVKDTGVLLIPPVAAYILLTYRASPRVVARALVAYGAGAAAIFVAENTVYWLYTGHFFYRQIALAAAHNTSIAASTPSEFLGETLANLRLLGTRHVVFGFAVVLAAIPCWLAILRQGRLEQLAALLGLFTLAYLVGGTSSLQALVHLPYQPRYIQPVMPFAVLGVTAVISMIAASRRRLAWLAASAMIVITLVPSFVAAPLLAGNLFNEPYYRAAARVSSVLTASGRPVYMTANELQAMHHFIGADQLDRLTALPTDSWPDGYYIINPARHPWEPIAAASGASRLFDVELDTRTARNYCLDCQIPYPSRESKRRVVVLEKSP